MAEGGTDVWIDGKRFKVMKADGSISDEHAGGEIITVGGKSYVPAFDGGRFVEPAGNRHERRKAWAQFKKARAGARRK